MYILGFTWQEEVTTPPAVGSDFGYLQFPDGLPPGCGEWSLFEEHDSPGYMDVKGLVTKNGVCKKCQQLTNM